MRADATPVKFLLVDDRQENLVALEAILKRDGLEVLKAQSGQQALELLLSHDVALALIDVHMPDMDGFELAELMRGAERSRRVPIIFVTAAREEAPRIFRGYDAGAVDFLFKPIEPRVLRHKAGVFFELDQQRRALADTLRFNELFIAAVSHELRNPLNTISLAAELLLGSATDPSVLRTANRIATSGRNMTRLLDDLFDLARTRVGSGMTLDRAEVDVRQVATRVVQDYHLKDTGHEVVLHAEGDCVGRLDEGRMEQALSNLVGNAVRHGTPGTAVRVETRGTGDRVTISVHNHGCIPHETLPHVFEAFRSGDTNRHRADGLGLGLYIVEQIGLAHGGEVRVTSTEDVGTTFTLCVPKRPPAA